MKPLALWFVFFIAASFPAFAQNKASPPNLDAIKRDIADHRALAQVHELGGRPEAALATLDRLVATYPDTVHRDEAQFRRGELLFNSGQYARAEQAYAQLVQREAGTPFHDRALYMHGWSVYKQGRLDDALQSFFGVLDLKIAGSGDEALDNLKGLSRADRELVEDTLRVTSVSLANLRTFPCIRRKERDGELKLRGAFFAISDGLLHFLDEGTGQFGPVE